MMADDARVGGQFVPVTGHLFPQHIAAMFELERACVAHALRIDGGDAAAQHERAQADAYAGRQLHVHARAPGLLATLSVNKGEHWPLRGRNPTSIRSRWHHPKRERVPALSDLRFTGNE